MKSCMTTLCYIVKDDCYLLMHRTKKENDINKNKWIGIGGHFEPTESPEECVLREVKEETGLTLTSYRFRGIVTFVTETGLYEYMCLYTAEAYEGEICDCEEGMLEWISKERLPELNLWRGDYIFLRLLEERENFFSLKLVYQGDVLKEAVLDGRELPQEEW